MQAISLTVRAGHPLHQYFETILQKVPVELRDRMNRRQLPEDTPTDAPSEKALIRLHKQVHCIVKKRGLLLFRFILSQNVNNIEPIIELHKTLLLLN